MTTVYFHVPDVSHAAGGIRTAYRMADACNARGVAAAILHQRRGFKPTWFDSDTRIAYAQDTLLRGNDVLVLSELDAPRLLRTAQGVTKVILNQHQYWTFVSGSVDYRHPDVAAVLTVSADGIRYLTHAFPGLQPHRLHCAVDTELFQPGSARKPIISYLGTKGAWVRSQVLAIVEHRGLLANWTIRPLAGLTHPEMAAALSESAILASFSEYEGFQILLPEAMAAGCAVVGFDAGGGREYLTEAVAWPVPAGDVVGFVERLETVAHDWETAAGSLEEKLRRGAALVRREYTLEIEAGDTVAALEPVALAARSKPSGVTHNVAEIPSVMSLVSRRVRAATKALLP